MKEREHGEETQGQAGAQGERAIQEEGAKVSGAGIVKRAREPSTWAGLAALAVMFGQHETAAALQLLGASLPDVFAAGAALVAVVMREPGAK